MVRKNEVETRRFGMHQNLLMDVIKRQAGSLHKSVLEGVMNAVDAKATEIDISLTSNELIIKDNGIGMTNRQTILDLFEVFGQPPREGEKKTYGQFRLGRGQLFAYGHNTWTTGPFTMIVDIKNRGLDYDLIERENQAVGCHVHIKLYEPILPSDKAQIERELSVSVKYVPAKITFNGEPITVDPASVKWDFETDEAYIKLKDTGNLTVFNLGVLVCSHAGYVFGCGGEVVSKQQLRVNFARNEVMSDCAVWKKIKPIVNRKADERTAKAPTLTDDGRQRLADQIKAGELEPHKARKAKVLTDVNGRHWSIDQLQPYKWNSACTSAEAGDKRGGTIHSHRLAFVFSDGTLERFGVTKLSQLLRILDKIAPLGFEEKDFDTLTEAMDAHCILVEEKEWNAIEQTVMQVLGGGIYRLTRGQEDIGRYKVVVGMSECADVWTDAQTFVAFNRKFIEETGTSMTAWVTYGQALINNLCAESANHQVQHNSPEFYQQCNAWAEESLAGFVDYCITYLPKAVEQLGRRLTAQQLKEADRAEKHKTAEQTLIGLAAKRSDN